MEGKELAIVDSSMSYGLPTKQNIKEFQDFLKSYDKFVMTQLVDKTDYGVIPGVEKPTLLKPGAEKLEKLFFLTHKKEQIDKIVRDDYISYTYRTTIFDKNGNIKATCEGTCNSKEKKYRYTWTASDKKPSQDEANQLKSKGLGKWTKQGDNWVWLDRADKEDYYDIENTIMKMAQKRSYVGAILEATNSSARFTQDIESAEDLPNASVEIKNSFGGSEKFGDVEYEVVDEFKQTCPVCGKKHNGQYPKCIDCWKAEQSKPKQEVKTKKVINEDEPPF